MPFVIPTATTAGVEGLVLDGLNLAQGAGGAIMLHAFSPPLFAKRKEWVEAADADGAILARDPLISVGDATITVAVPGVSRDDANATIGTLIDKLEEADRNPGGIPLVWTPSGSSVSGTAYVLTGEVTELPVDWESGYMANQPMVTFTLSCKPGWYLDPVTYTGSATAGPLVTLEIGSVPGDAPADATLRVTESSSQSRRTMEWGAEQRYYNPASPWSLVLDSDNLVTSGFAGTQTTLAGSYDPGASGNAIVVSTVATSPQVICGTGVQPHIGTFRVMLRLNTGSAGCTNTNFRFAWRAGDGSYTTNAAVTVTDSTQEFLERDLGLITIPEANAGTQSWDGRVEGWNLAGSDTVYVDYLMLIPIEAGFGKATASYTYTPGTIVARDSFTGLGSGAALSARVPDAGAAWVTSGVATDFVGSTTTETTTTQPRVTRTTNALEAEARAAVLGGAMTNQEVSGVAYCTSPIEANMGLVARYVDDDNYLRLNINAPTTGTIDKFEIQLVKKIAGVETTITTKASASTFQANVAYTLKLVVFDSGRMIGSVSTGTTAQGTVDATDSALATGGVLASGKGGIADQALTAVGAGQARKYDDVVVSTPASEPVVLYSGRKIEIRHDSAERESSAGGTWGQPSSYRGSRFRVPPAGDANRTTRVAVKASRNDLTSAEDANLTDQIQLTAVVTPRCTVIPRV